MQSFIDGLITFLNAKFNSDSSITNKPLGHYAYEKGLEPTSTTPFYIIQLLDDTTSDEDFEKEASCNVPIQITLYGVKMKINNVLKNPQNVSFYFADKCKQFMEQYKYDNTNDVLEMRRTASTPAIPYEDGSKAYYSVLRYNIKIKE